MYLKELLDRTVSAVEDVGHNNLLKLQALSKHQPVVKEIEKKGKDFLTNLDLVSHSLLSKKLRKIYPKIPIYSEEGKERIKRTRGKSLIIDPLDGSINYFHQDVFWGLSVALVKNSQTQLGVVYLPALKQLAGVTKTGDSFSRGDISLRVRKDRDIARAQIWLDWGKESKAVLLLFPRLGKVSLYPQIRLCCTASLLAVAGGKIAAYVHPNPEPEDIAAGCLIVEKAGGKVTDFEGNPWTPFSKSIVASNGLVHRQILEVLK